MVFFFFKKVTSINSRTWLESYSLDCANLPCNIISICPCALSWRILNGCLLGWVQIDQWFKNGLTETKYESTEFGYKRTMSMKPLDSFLELRL